MLSTIKKQQQICDQDTPEERGKKPLRLKLEAQGGLKTWGLLLLLLLLLLHVLLLLLLLLLIV